MVGSWDGAVMVIIWIGLSGLALQVLAEASVQRVKVNVFDGGLMAGSVRPVLPGPPFGLAHAHPVGGPVSGARKTVGLHKGLQQTDGMPIFGLPIGAEPLGNPAQNVAGLMRCLHHPGQDEKASIVSDEMKALGPHTTLPTDVA